jgi:hypothetical protein
MTTDEILKQITSPKPKPEKPDKPKRKVGGQLGWCKKVDSDKFIHAATKYLYEGGINLEDASKMCDLSRPTFVKMLNILYTEGKLDGKHFFDGEGVVLDLSPNNYDAKNDRILRDITR